MRTTYLRDQMKQLVTASTLFLGILAVSQVSYAGDRGGNGGSGGESEIAAQQAQFENVALKIKQFFVQNEDELAPQFKEVNIPNLISKIDSSRILVNDEALTDRHGKKRTCLNFAKENLIHCNATALKALNESPEALFVLAFHEYLGLLGVEETSPNDPTVVDGYSISKKIAPYVTLVNDYDLRLKNKRCKIGTNSEDLNPFFFRNKNFRKVHTQGARIFLDVNYKGKKASQIILKIRDENYNFINYLTKNVKDLETTLNDMKPDLEEACKNYPDFQAMGFGVDNKIPYLAKESSEWIIFVGGGSNYQSRRADKLCQYWGFDFSIRYRKQEAKMGVRSSKKMYDLEGGRLVVKKTKPYESLGGNYYHYPEYFTEIYCGNN